MSYLLTAISKTSSGQSVAKTFYFPPPGTPAIGQNLDKTWTNAGHGKLRFRELVNEDKIWTKSGSRHTLDKPAGVRSLVTGEG